MGCCLDDGKVHNFRFWCQKVLPLVYDDSLSYYEVLCKVVDYINKLIDSDKAIIEDVEALQRDMKTVQEWIDNFNYEPLLNMVREMVDKYVAIGIYFGLSDNGHVVAYIPQKWETVTFRTTGYDIDVPIEPEYGHLVLLF